MLPGGGFPLPPAAQELCQSLPPPNCFHGPHVVVEKLCEVRKYLLISRVVVWFFSKSNMMRRYFSPFAYQTLSPLPPWVRVTPPSCLSLPSRCSGRAGARGEEGGRTAKMRGVRPPPMTSTERGCTKRLSEESKMCHRLKCLK